MGRLDFQSEGLMILTNDGALTRKITRAGTMEKIYKVKVRGQPAQKQLDWLCGGITVEGEKFSRCKIAELKKTRKLLVHGGASRGEKPSDSAYVRAHWSSRDAWFAGWPLEG